MEKGPPPPPYDGLPGQPTGPYLPPNGAPPQVIVVHHQPQPSFSRAMFGMYPIAITCPHCNKQVRISMDDLYF